MLQSVVNFIKIKVRTRVTNVDMQALSVDGSQPLSISPPPLPRPHTPLKLTPSRSQPWRSRRPRGSPWWRPRGARAWCPLRRPPFRL
jgi:hypothetical protein